MCGIVGYIGDTKAKDVLINGLKRLEYRGYDSAGIATLYKDKICCVKNKGRVAELEEMPTFEKINGNIGIAHTRWATHGKPSTKNSHPHLDNSKKFAVVHNGIIENHEDLRNMLIGKGYKFHSQTDTEVIPNLIDYYYKKYNNVLFAFQKTCEILEGSYAIELITTEIKDCILITKKSSPLVIGVTDDEKYISSDIPALLDKTKKFYLLEDDEIAVVKKGVVDFFDKDLNLIIKEVKEIDWEADSASKGDFEDFMLKEIFEQSKTIKDTIGYRLPQKGNAIVDEIKFTKEYLLGLKRIYIVACGTALHAGIVGKNLIEQLAKLPVEVEMASEFRYKNPILDDKTLAIFISQSGETADTLAAVRLAKENNAKTIAITNVMGSTITREAEHVLYTCAGPEIAVASTKAYTSQVVLLSIFAIHLAEILDLELPENLKDEIKKLPNKVSEILDNIEEYQKLAKKFKNEKDMFFIGRGIDYAVAMEASLKLKEITYIHSESYASGELKHGPIALIEDKTKMICIMTDPDLVEKSMSNVQEVISRGAEVILLTNQSISKEDYKIIEIPETNKLISPVLSIIPLQLLSYYVAKEKNLDVDKPRNLAKSVTVE